MITLNLKRENHWIDILSDVRLFVRPATTAVVMAARAAALKGADAEMDRGAAFVKSLARIAIVDWQGIGDTVGDPAPVTPDNVDALLDLWPVSEAFERLYLAPALLLEQEKNV